MYPRGANASFCVVCCVKLYFVFLGLSLVKMFHLCPACNQDVHPSKGKFLCCARLYMCTLYATFIPSFGNFLSRCSIYWQGNLFACMCACLCIVCATFVLSRCCIFRQLLVKMFHLSARKVVFVCVHACALCVQLSCCQDVASFGSFSSRCSIFRRGKLCLYVCVHVHCVCNFRAVKMLHLSAASRQDVPSFGEESCVCMCACMCIVCATFVLSRCCIVRQLLVKMFHLSARKVVFVCVRACALCVQLSCCQDVASFGSFSSRCSIFRRGKLCLYVCVHVHCVCNFRAVKMLHLLAASHQDVPSFGEESCVCMCACMCIVCATFVLSRCCIFRQLLVKMFHLSATKVVFICVRACALCVQLSCCQDVASFGSFSSRCSIFRRGKLFVCVCACMCIVCVHACALCVQLPYCQDVPSFGEESCVCMCACMHVHCVCNFRTVKMFHLSAASRQDIMFWQFLVKISIFCVLQSVHMYCLCQDVPVCLCIVLQQRKCYSILSREIFMRVCIILTTLVLSRYAGRECL